MKRDIPSLGFLDVLKFKTNQLIRASREFSSELSLNKIDFITQNTKSQGSIFEFGSGGSTLEFLRRGFSVTSVETDRLFARRVNKVAYKEFGLNPVVFNHIGLTGSYGYPLTGLNLTKRKHAKFAKYTKSGCVGGYDTVVIDGRFRVASFIAILIFSPELPQLICIDDYKDRVEYKQLNEILEFDGEIDGLFYIFPKCDIKLKDAMKLYSRYINDPR